VKIPPFSVTYDYRCPFARNAHEHLFAALRSGAGWDVEVVPFSLTQSHLEERDTPVWEDESRSRDLLAVEAGLVVKELAPESFSSVHLALFAARHDEGRDLREAEVVKDVLAANDLDPARVFESISEGWPRAAFRKAHEAAVAEHAVFGVPTFIVDDDAVFVRIMSRPGDDPESSVDVIEQVMRLMVETPELNEVKHTRIPN
jgi:predicted DsbA family dithiol-disulfide isomerase